MLTVCERFGKLPSEILDEGVEFLQMLKIEAMGKEGEADGR